MLCDICHKNIATIHLTEIINEKVVETHLCEECSKLKTEELKDQVSLSEFLTGLMSEKDLKKEKYEGKCLVCGLTYKEFRKKGRLGCAQCYQAFKAQLLPILKRIHGSASHRGKNPSAGGIKDSPEAALRELKEKLKRAVEFEAYEEAARLRDEIRKLTGGWCV